MAYLIRDVAPGAFTPSRKAKRHDDENGDDDFARWMSAAEPANEEAPRRPLTQKPMTSLEDLLLLAKAREQIADASMAPGAYVDMQAPDIFNDENQYTFDFIADTSPGTRLNKQI